MKLLVLGGTGKTGRQLVSQALDAGHDVTVLARDPAKIATQDPRLRVIAGDVGDVARLTDALRGQDAVISAIGRGMSFKSENLMERSVPNILAAMQSTGVKRLLFTSAIGVTDTFADLPLMGKLFCGTLLRGIYADKLVADRLIRKSSVEWTIVEPSQLTDGPLTRQYRSGEHLAFQGIAMPQISRADTAHFMLGLLNNRDAIRKSLVVSH